VLRVPVTQEFWQDATIGPATYDVVTLFHTVEHLESPLDAMRHLRGWLKPNGLLVAEVPNVEAVCQHPHTPFHVGHLHHFNIETLGMTARRAGYAVVDRSITADGGIITIVARRSSDPLPLSNEIPGNYERVARVLRGHTTFSHLLTAHPYVRPLRKVASRLEEALKATARRSAADVLNALIAGRLPRLATTGGARG
jgi:SAM-dependent methyltransferase